MTSLPAIVRTTSSTSSSSMTSTTMSKRKNIGAAASAANNNNANEGMLEASILSVYDLPYSQAPTSVTLTTGTVTGKTGGPVARHKDRNSFRFSPVNTTSSNSLSSMATPSKQQHVVQLRAPLRELYNTKSLTIRVVYANAPTQVLETTYAVQHQLQMNEAKWLILTLEDKDHVTVRKTNEVNPSTVGGGDEDVAPTIRLKLQLTGPYRPEFAALIHGSQQWCRWMDGMEHHTTALFANVSKAVAPIAQTVSNPNVLLLPAVPILAAIVMLGPVIGGLAMVIIPVFLPLILAVLGGVGASVAAMGILYFSTATGRALMHTTLGPLLESFVSSRAGQTLVYDTGPRPTPVHVARQVVPTTLWAKLMISLFIDLIGSSSYLLPVVGEVLDIGWAPLQTILLMAMYDDRSPHLKYVSFVEEILPFTDIVPTATIGWAIEFVPSLVLGEDAEETVTKVMDTLLVKKSTGAATRNGVANPQNPYR